MLSAVGLANAEIVEVGGVVSTVQANDAGVASAFPDASTA